MILKLIKFLLPLSLILVSCVNNQVSNLQKSVTYNLEDYQIFINSPKGLCVNNDLAQEKKKFLLLVFTECISNPNSTDLIRRPISSIITVKFQYEDGLDSFDRISDFIRSTNFKLNHFFNLNGYEINNSSQKDNTIFLSVTSKNKNNQIGAGVKFWKSLSLYENILISTSAYGFSQKTSNYASYRELKEKLILIVNSIKIKKTYKNSSV